MGLGGGDEFAGYRVERELARGGMGIVYVARDVELDRLVALKVLGADAVDDEEFRRRFRLESRTAAAIDHPNVVGVHEAREHEGELYIAMQYVPGRDLKSEIRRVGRLEPGLAAEVISQAADGLDAVHAAGLIHRDVKPANILLHTPDSPDSNVRALITDFGIARAENPTTQMTATGLFVGTLDYVSPEQLQGHRIDARSDVYALGCALYEAVSGSVPFPDAEGPAKMFGHVHGPRPQLDPALGRQVTALQPVIERAMATDPEDRFPSAGDLGRAAQAAAAGVPPPPQTAEGTVAEGAAAPPVPPPPRAPAPPPPEPRPRHEPARPSTGRTVPRIPAEDERRGRWRIAVASAVLLAAVAVAAYALLLGGGDDADAVTRLTADDAQWQASTEGESVSTPAVDEGQLIVGSDSGSVFAFDTKDGTERWRFDTPREVRSSPTVDDDRAYVGSFDGGLYSIDLEGGGRVWRAPTGNDIYSSPALSGSTLVVGSADVFAFDRRDGAEIWSFPTGGLVNSSPAIDAGKVFIGGNDGSVYAIDLASGAEIWSEPISSGEVVSSPSVGDETVYVGGEDGLSAFATADGATRWIYDIDQGVNSSPAVSSDQVVFAAGDGKVYAIRADSAQLQWSFTPGGAASSSPVIDAGIVYFGSTDGTVYGLDLDSGEVRWTFDAGSQVSATPVVSDGVVYVVAKAGTVFALPTYDG